MHFYSPSLPSYHYRLDLCQIAYQFVSHQPFVIFVLKFSLSCFFYRIVGPLEQPIREHKSIELFHSHCIYTIFNLKIILTFSKGSLSFNLFCTKKKNYPISTPTERQSKSSFLNSTSVFRPKPTWITLEFYPLLSIDQHCYTVEVLFIYKVYNEKYIWIEEKETLKVRIQIALIQRNTFDKHWYEVKTVCIGLICIALYNC